MFSRNFLQPLVALYMIYCVYPSTDISDLWLIRRNRSGSLHFETHPTLQIFERISSALLPEVPRKHLISKVGEHHEISP